MTRFEIEGNTTRLVSNLNMFGETLFNGRFVGYMRSLSGRPCFQGDNDPMDVDFIKPLIGKYPIESFELEINGQSLHSGWKWVKAYEIKENNKTHGVVELENKVMPVTVEVHSRLDGTAFIERWLEITNKSNVSMGISKINPMSGMLWRIADKKEHGLPVPFKVGILPNCEPLTEGSFQLRDLKEGITGFESIFGGRSGWGLPWFCVQNCVSGEVFVAHLEWSGNWEMFFNVADFYGAKETSLLFTIGPKARAPQIVIAPGERLTSPIMHLGHVHGSTDKWVQETHKHIRNVSLKVTKENLYIGAARMVDGELDWLENEVKLASAAGMEYFLIDAGWYGENTGKWWTSVGDWDVTRFNNTMAGAREIIHKYGMKFGMWLEPEGIGSDSKLFADNPDWPIKRDGAYADGIGRVLDMSKPEVFDFVQKSVMDLFDVHNVDYYKIDYNNYYINEHGENMRDGFMENASYRYVQALYAVYDKVIAEHPEVFLENCAGGGGRNDLGLFRRMHANTLSDYAVFPRSIKALNNVTMALPPDRIRFYYRHFPGYHMYGDLETQLRYLMFCVPVFVGFGRGENWFNPYENEIVTKYVDLFKNYCRVILENVKVYHHTPGLEFDAKDPWCALEYADENNGYAAVFRLIEGTDEYVLNLRGIDIGRSYKVTFMNTGKCAIIDGVTLTTTGIPIRLSGALSSEMLLYQVQ